MYIKNLNNINLDKVVYTVVLTVIAKKAQLAPPVGPILGQFDIKVINFCNDFNSITKPYPNNIPLRVHIYIYKDSSFDYIILSPPCSFLIKNTLKSKKINKLNLLNLYKIFLIKNIDSNNNIAKIALLKQILGTLKSMNITNIL